MKLENGKKTIIWARLEVSWSLANTQVCGNTNVSFNLREGHKDRQIKHL